MSHDDGGLFPLGMPAHAPAAPPMATNVTQQPASSKAPMFIGIFYPIYVRGLAYLAAHQGAEAAAEFRRILDGRSVVVSDPIGALAHVQLGRALVLSGEKIEAETAYQNSLTLWKDADPDIPILTQAKSEYAKLLEH